MINEEKDRPSVEIAPFGIFSPAVSVEHVDSFDGMVIQQSNTLVSSKVADWNNLTDYSSAVSVYTSPATNIYTEGYSFHVYLETEYSSANLSFNEEYIDGAFDQVEQASLQQAIESQIWSIMDNDPDKVEVNSTNTIVRYGVAVLEGTFGNNSFGEKGLLHLPRTTASSYRAETRDDVLYSFVGTPIVAGTGYPINSFKAFMTGPVTVRIAAYNPFYEVDHKTNTVRAFRDYPVVVSIMDTPHVAHINLELDYTSLP